MSSQLMQQLLEAGAHFGHRTYKWNPKMAPYIYTHKNGIHIIDLRKTVFKLKEAATFIYEISKKGGEVLFVGCKKQARTVVRKESIESSSPFVSERWLGGTLTNYETICKSIDKLRSIEKMREDGTIHYRPKKEVLKLKKLEQRLQRDLEGIRNIDRVPDALVVVDILKEQIAIKEAHVLGIPIVGLVDTNSNPEDVNICIPVNDDALKANELLLKVLSAAVKKGKGIYLEKLKEEEAKRLKKEEEENLLKEQEEKKRFAKEKIKRDRDLLKEKATEIARKNREKDRLEEERKKQSELSSSQKKSVSKQAASPVKESAEKKGLSKQAASPVKESAEKKGVSKQSDSPVKESAEKKGVSKQGDSPVEESSEKKAVSKQTDSTVKQSSEKKAVSKQSDSPVEESSEKKAVSKQTDSTVKQSSDNEAILDGSSASEKKKTEGDLS